jgi:hypothetical protein
MANKHMKGKPPMAAPAAPAAAPGLTPADDKAALDGILTRIAQERGRPAIVYWTSPLAKISIGVELPLFDQLRAIGKQQSLDLILFTGGGDTEAPIRIVSLIREFCDSLSVIVPHAAMSAGTCIALGADEIVMTPLSVLGPIDPSRSHPLLPKREGAAEPEQISVQDLRHAMQFIREAAKTDTSSGLAYTPEAMAQIFSALFDKIHPLAIGAIEQSYALAKLVGTRCLETHMGSTDADREKIASIVDKLCDQYKTHSYPISRHEATAIGLKVTPASATLEPLILELYKLYLMRKFGPFGTIAQGKEVTMHIAWLDSLKMKFRAVQKLEVNAKKELEPRGDQWLPY